METYPRQKLRCNGCSCISRKKLIAAGYALLAIGSRVGFFIVTPIWLDYFNPINATSLTNHTHDDLETYGGNSFTCPHSSNPYFAALGQWTFSSLVLGLGLGLIQLFSPRRIRADVEGSYPKRQFALIGFSQGLSTMFTAFAISGSRTPPYLQAILTNFALPIQFVVRFVVLRKRPGCMKVACAVVITISEFVCLIPTIFPSLENDKEHRQEGGSTGLDRFLWPAFLVTSQVPFAVANSLMERSVQSKQTTKAGSSPDQLISSNDHERRDNDSRYNNGIDNNARYSNGIDNDSRDNEHSSTIISSQPPADQRNTAMAAHLQLNLIYFNFWWTSCVVATLVCMFWVDILPVIGTSSSLSEFGDKMWFNFQCLFGGAHCVGVIAFLGWLDFSTVLLGNFAFSGLMRHSEGANFVMIVMTVRTPIIFLFWTLFVEQPFAWQPHASLSTWLSIAAIFVMVAAIVLYDRAPSEVVADRERRDEVSEDRQPLVTSQPSFPDDDDVTYEQQDSSRHRAIQSDPAVRV